MAAQRDDVRTEIAAISDALHALDNRLRALAEQQAPFERGVQQERERVLAKIRDLRFRYATPKNLLGFEDGKTRHEGFHAALNCLQRELYGDSVR